MNTVHQRSYEIEPIVIGRGLDEFAREDEWRPTTFEIEDVSHELTAALQAFESEVAMASVAAVSLKPSAPVRSAGQRCRQAISSAASMIAVAAGIAAAWTAAWVSSAIVLISRSIESGRARRRAVWKPLNLQWIGASVLRHRRGTVAAFSVALLALVLAPPSNPPAVSPVAAVSTSTSPEASTPTVERTDSSKGDSLPAALPAERLTTTMAPPRPAVVRAALHTAAPSAAPEAQKPVLLAVTDVGIAGTGAPEPTTTVVANLLPALEEPKPAAAEPAVLVRPAIETAAGTVIADRSAIDDVLAAYRRSYNALDAGAVSAIWRGADTRALARAFSSLSHQRLTFEQCDVRVTAADRARARCDGLLSYVPRAGDTSPQQRRVSWSIDLGRPDDRWVIVGVQAR